MGKMLMAEGRLKFTRHAREVMVKRGVDELTLLNGVESPDKIFLDRRSNLIVAVKENEQALVVLYDPINDCFEIVTVFKTSKLVRLIRSRLDKGCWVRVR